MLIKLTNPIWETGKAMAIIRNTDFLYDKFMDSFKDLLTLYISETSVENISSHIIKSNKL